MTVARVKVKHACECCIGMWRKVDDIVSSWGEEEGRVCLRRDGNKINVREKVGVRVRDFAIATSKFARGVSQSSCEERSSPTLMPGVIAPVLSLRLHCQQRLSASG